MIKKVSKNEQRLRRHQRVRKNVAGTGSRPRLAVFRSARHIYAQVIDDVDGQTLVSASSLEPAMRALELSPVEMARAVGELCGQRALEKGLEAVVFDRGGYRYHGRVAALADGARGKGLQF